MSLDQVLAALFNGGIVIAVGATVLSLGMTFTVRQLVAPLNHVGLVVAMVATNALVIPGAAWGIAEASPMSDEYTPGLVMATLGAGSAASLKAAQLAKRSDLPLAVSVVVVLQLVNIVSVPLWAGRVVTGASLSAWDVVKSLLGLVLLPLVIGLVTRARHAGHALAWRKQLVKVANLALVVALSTGVAANWSMVKPMLASWLLPTAIIIVVTAGVLGTLVGRLLGPQHDSVPPTTGLVSVFRFSGLGLVIVVAQLQGDPIYLAPAITFALINLILPSVLAVGLGRRTPAAQSVR